MQLFRANVDSGGLSIRIRCRGTRSGGPCRPHTRLSSLHFAPPLIHSRSIIPTAETHRVYLRDALIYPALVSLYPAFVSHFHLSPDRSAWRVGIVAALIISVISTASTREIGEVGAPDVVVHRRSRNKYRAQHDRDADEFRESRAIRMQMRSPYLQFMLKGRVIKKLRRHSSEWIVHRRRNSNRRN